MQYIALLRGINVGGGNKVNMQALRNAMERQFDDVRTYIQSGNLVFRSALKSQEDIAAVISGILAREFHVRVPVIVRDEKAWKRTVQRNPFLNETDDYTKLLVTFLSSKAAPADVRTVQQISFPHDAFVVDGADVYLYCRDGYGKSDIPNTFFERHLKVTSTTRNWRTVLQLMAILKT